MDHLKTTLVDGGDLKLIVIICLPVSDKCDCTIFLFCFENRFSKVYFTLFYIVPRSYVWAWGRWEPYCCINNQIKFICHNIFNSCVCYYVSMTFRIKEKSHICGYIVSSSGESKDEYFNRNQKFWLLFWDRTIIGQGVLDLYVKW
jgi:hypothetical protein